MGLALAKAARDAGFDVTLLLGPVSVHLPRDINVIRFTTCEDLRERLAECFPLTDILIMAAAVADYRPAVSHEGKMPRQDSNLTIQLEPTPDLVAECVSRKQPHQRIIGFALEEPAVMERRAVEKLKRKGLDAIVANPLATMGSDSVAAKVYTSAGESMESAEQEKPRFAAWLIELITKLD